MVLNRIKLLPVGYSEVEYNNKKYGVTRSDFNNGKSFKVYAEELGGTDFISLNFYITSTKRNLKPCEMPEHKVLHFLKHYKLLKPTKMQDYKKAYIAGGCFWGMEDLYRNRPGVKDTEVGYIGGENDHPTYRNHPGHAEGIEITYDPNETSFQAILDYFFRIHNPTTVDRQGNDIGSSYRSTIFFQNEEEKAEAEYMIKRVNDSKKWDGEVVTTLEPYTTFWPAEPEHQDYLVKHPNGYTCHFERFEESFI